MKQLLPLFLALLPWFAWAQYPSNANQKITLGEQTTADGLFYRGLAADTTRKPSVDTMAYMLLDTATNIMWHYKKATSNAWLRVGGSISSGLTGTLPVANGGTGRTTMPDGYILHGDGNAVDTSIGLFWDRTNNRLGIETISPAHQIDVVKTGNINVTMRVKNDSAFNLFQIIAGYPRWVTNDTRVNGKRFDLSNGEISKGVFSIVNITNGNYALVIDGNNNNNLGIGTESPGSRLVVKGVSTTSANSALNVTNSSDNSLLFVRNDGNVGIGNSTPTFKLDVTGTGNYTGALTATSSITGAAITLTGTTGYGFISDANSFRRIWFENEGLNRTLFDLRSSGTNFSFRKNTGTIIAIIDSLGNGLFTGSVSANSLSLTTPLSVANGGTGATSFSPNNYLIRTNSSGIFDTSAIYEAGGNVGIGTTSPKAKLNIFGSVGSGSLTIQQDLVHIGGNELGGDGGYAGIRLAGSSSTSYGVYIRGVKTNIFGGYWNSALTFNVTRTSEETIIDEVMRITSGSEVNIGYGTTDNGAYRLQVKDSVYVGGNVSAAAYTTRSDYNLKDDIYNLKYGLNDILQLQPVEYTYKSNGSKQLGFIAQDIGTILPEVVSFEESMTVNYQAIIPILTKAIQEQQALIKALEQRIINLENK